MRLCIMLILNSCPEQRVCVHVRLCLCLSGYLGKFQLSPRNLHSRSSSALRTSASSRRAATVSSGDTTLGGISAGYRGVTCGWRTPRKVSAKKLQHLFLRREKNPKKTKQKTDKVEGAHHGQSVEKDVDKFWSVWVGQRSVQQALNYTLENKMY